MIFFFFQERDHLTGIVAFILVPRRFVFGKNVTLQKSERREAKIWVQDDCSIINNGN